MIRHLAIVHAVPVQSPLTEILRMPCKTGMLLQQGDERRNLLEDVLGDIAASGAGIRNVTEENSSSGMELPQWTARLKQSNIRHSVNGFIRYTFYALIPE